MIYMVSTKQDLHFQQLFRTLELVGYSDLTSHLQHIGFGNIEVSWPNPDSGLLLGDILDKYRTITYEFLEANQDKEF